MGKVHLVESPGGEAMEVTLPLEPLRSLAVATELIPMRSIAALTQFLFYHKEEFPARYLPGRYGKQHRMLYDSEILKIRKMLLIEDGTDTYHSAPFQAARQRARKNSSSPINEIMRRAMGT